MSQLDPVWYKALSLQERCGSMPMPLPQLDELGRQRSQRRLQHWRTQKPFGEEHLFAERLAQDGISTKELGYLLTEDPDTLATRFGPLPLWAQELTEAFALAPTCWEPETPPTSGAGQPTDAFLTLTRPLVSYYQTQFRTQLRDLVRAFPAIPFEPENAERLCVSQLLPHLRSTLNRTLVLELHVSRLSKQLSGETADERFADFITHLCQKDIVMTLLHEYPVLARALIEHLQRWLGVTLEMLQRLCEDWLLLTTTLLSETEPGLLASINTNAGDQHRGGHTVTILTFTSGWHVVYKPRSLAIEQHFQELLTWLNVQGQQPQFRVMRLLDRGEYGWCEYIHPHTCTSAEEVHHFYQRQGSYLALLHLLAATDYHHENIIAMSEHPMLVDLESLFQPYFGSIREDTALADSQAGHLLAHSVFRVGMLPSRSWEHAQSAGIDQSGLGSASEQLSPRASQYWEKGGTDEMHISRKRLPLFAGEQNRPMLNGQRVTVLDYREALLDGFTRTYELLTGLRELLLSAQSPLTRFQDDEIRVILRPTHIYSLLLREGYHPDVLRDGLDRERFFDKLWIHAAHFPYLIKVIWAERHDLWRGDIPIFSTRPQTIDIWTSTGERIRNFLKQTAMETVRERLQSLCPEDLHWQTWLIRASLTALDTNQSEVSVRSYQPFLPSGTATSQRLLEAACAIGDQLETQALCAGQSASWIGLHAFQEQYWKIAPLGLDLYGGLPGVALFLAYLGSVSGEARYRTLAQAALTNIRSQIQHHPEVVQQIGGFSGWGGLIYVLTHLGVLWQQEILFTEAEQLARVLAPMIEQDTSLDVMHGAAGCIGSLAGLYELRPSSELRTLILRCGEHLLSKVQVLPQGIGWVTPLASVPLTGFSHGAAGVAWALLRLAAISGEHRFSDAARNALSYEQAHFSEECNNWLDLREENATDMVAWCHGAAGIGLGRLASLPYLDTPQSRSDIERALRTTLVRGFGHNHSLCHGDFGNLDFLLMAARLLGRDDLKVQASEKAAMLLESLDRYGWHSGIPLNIETPGLMVGLAGTGYGLLRCAAPDRVPSVLVLETPHVYEQR